MPPKKRVSCEDTVVVFAGYLDKMKAFYDRNPGLRLIVPFSVRFDDYSADEMLESVKLEAERGGFEIEPEAEGRVKVICNTAAGDSEAGNGRFCRNSRRSIKHNRLALLRNNCYTREAQKRIQIPIYADTIRFTGI